MSQQCTYHIIDSSACAVQFFFGIMCLVGYTVLRSVAVLAAAQPPFAFLTSF
jgi:hypothetical protein